jgi:hypothetical protein
MLSESFSLMKDKALVIDPDASVDKRARDHPTNKLPVFHSILIQRQFVQEELVP